MLVGLGSFSGLLLCFVAADRMSPLASIVLADPIGYLSNFVSIPGGIGGLDGSFVGMLVLYGVNATTAAAVTLVYHSIALWIPALWGAVAFVILYSTEEERVVPRAPNSRRHRS